MALYPFQYNDRTRVCLIDTPGFDDSDRTDFTVLEEIAAFLKKSYQMNIKLNGVIYLHRITDERVTGSSMRSLTMFKNLLGDDAYKNVMLATTRWEVVDPQVGDHREKDLVEKSKYWGLMKQKGCSIQRYDNSKRSAMKLINYFVERQKPKFVCEVQKEMVDRGKDLVDTAAGKEAQGQLAADLKAVQEELSSVQANMQEQLRNKDKELAQALRNEAMQRAMDVQAMQAAQRGMREQMKRQVDDRARQHERQIQEVLRAQKKTTQDNNELRKKIYETEMRNNAERERRDREALLNRRSTQHRAEPAIPGNNVSQWGSGYPSSSTLPASTQPFRSAPMQQSRSYPNATQHRAEPASRLNPDPSTQSPSYNAPASGLNSRSSPTQQPSRDPDAGKGIFKVDVDRDALHPFQFDGDFPCERWCAETKPCSDECAERYARQG